MVEPCINALVKLVLRLIYINNLMCMFRMFQFKYHIEILDQYIYFFNFLKDVICMSIKSWFDTKPNCKKNGLVWFGWFENNSKTFTCSLMGCGRLMSIFRKSKPRWSFII